MKRAASTIDGESYSTAKRARYNENETIEIDSALCSDTWSKIVEFCDTRDWLQLSYTCKEINRFKFNRSLMFNKQRTLKGFLSASGIEHYFQLGRRTLFNVHLNRNTSVMDHHFLYLEGIHTLNMNWCNQITDKAFRHLTGIHTLEMSCCHNVTSKAFSHLRRIHTLNMSCCNKIEDSAFHYLTGIRALEMRSCNQITDDSFHHLIGIHALDMRYCINITDRAFPHLVGIHTLYMDGCSQELITVKALSYLKGLHKLSCIGQDNSFIEKATESCRLNSKTLLRETTST